jgi:fructokinase
MVSRVGADVLGAEALRRLARNGIATDLVQIDPEHATGMVSVTLDVDGTPSYQIVKPAAWDFIELRPGLLERAASAAAIVFGSLAQRDAVTRATVERLCEVEVPKVFDVNLRPPYENPELVRRALQLADIVKINDHELRRMADWYGLPTGLREGTTALAEQFGCGTICVTRGGEGAALLKDGRWSEHAGYRVEVKDTVGSGDAFLAAFLSGLLAGEEDHALLQHANLLGAYVATQPGAVPVCRPDTLAMILAVNQEKVRPEDGGSPGGRRPGARA